MTLRELGKTLESLDAGRLKRIILGLAALNRQNSDWLDERLNPNTTTEELLARYKKKIRNAFLQSHRINLKEARQALNDFKKVCRKPECVLDLMVFYVETAVETENRYGDLYEAFYNSVENVFIDAVKQFNELDDSELSNKFKPRLQWIVENCAEGWAHRDTLEDWFEELK